MSKKRKKLRFGRPSGFSGPHFCAACGGVAKTILRDRDGGLWVCVEQCSKCPTVDVFGTDFEMITFIEHYLVAHSGVDMVSDVSFHRP